MNTVWMWAALLATAMSAWLQEPTRIDRGNGLGRPTIARLGREVFTAPAASSATPETLSYAYHLDRNC